MNAGWLRWALPALVVVLVVLAFLPALRNDFVSWDDRKNFLDNPHYRGLGWAQLRWMFTTTLMGPYIPLSWITLGLDYLLWGMDPRGYHLTSLLLHAGAALALYFLTLRLLGLALPREPARERDLRIAAAAAALLWAVHPLRAESVAWVTERRDVLCGLFYLLALIAYLRFAARQDSRRWYWAAFGLFVGALLSKAMAVTLPAVLLVLDAYPLGRLGGARGWLVRRVWAEKIPFILVAAADAAVAFLALLEIGNVRSLGDLGLPERLVLAVYGYAFYLFKSLVPLELSPFYPLDITVTWFHFGAVLGGCLLAALGWRRRPAVTAAWAVYLVTLLPVSGLFQNGPQAAADRYSYLPMLGASVLVAGLLARPWAGARPLRAVAAVWIVALAALTWQQAGVWRDSVTLWTQAYLVRPDSRAAHYNLARAYEEERRWGEALAHYREAARLSGSGPFWHVRIGALWERMGVPRGAAEAYREALRAEPGRADACEGLRRALDRGGDAAPDGAGCPGAR